MAKPTHAGGTHVTFDKPVEVTTRALGRWSDAKKESVTGGHLISRSGNIGTFHTVAGPGAGAREFTADLKKN